MNRFALTLAALAATITLYAQQPGTVRFHVWLDGMPAGNSVRAVFWPSIAERYFFSDHSRTIEAFRGRNGEFAITIDSVYRPGYVSLEATGVAGPGAAIHLLYLFLAEPGDHVDVKFTRDTATDWYNNSSRENYLWDNRYYRISFSGKGSEKYALKYAMDRAPQQLDPLLETRDRELRQLDSAKLRLTHLSYEIMKSDIVCKYGLKFLGDVESRGKLTRENFSLRRFPLPTVSGQASVISEFYPGFAIIRARLADELESGLINSTHVYAYLKGTLSGQVRDRVLTIFIRQIYIARSNDSILKDALTTVRENYWRSQLEPLANFMTIGSHAYNFKLEDTQGNWVRLSDFKGKVVFIDFWFSGCINCVSYYRATVSRVEDSLIHDPNVVFITIATDRDKEIWKKSINSGEYTTPRIVNLLAGGAGGDNPVVKHYGVFAAPRPLIIDREGKIYRTDGLRTTAHDLLEILRKAAALNPPS